MQGGGATTIGKDWRIGRKDVQDMSGTIPISQRTRIAFLLAVVLTIAALLAVSRFAVLLNADLATPGALCLLLILLLDAQHHDG